MSKLSVGRKSGLLRGGFLLALLAIVMGLVVGCGEEGTPSGNGGGTGIPTSFTVTAILATAAGPVAANTPATLSGTSTAGAFTPVTVTVGANGSVQFNNVPPGTYVITANGISSTPIVVRQNAVNLGTVLLGPPSTIIVGAPLTVTGQLVSSNGASVANLPVTLTGTGGTFATTNPGSGPTGAFSIPNVPPGTYTLSAPGFSPIANIAVNSTNGGNLGAVTLVPTGPITGTFTVTGRLVTSSGAPAANLPVTLTPIGGTRQAVQTLTGTTDANGVFTIPNVPAGTYLLTVPGFNAVTIVVPGANGGNLGTIVLVPVTTGTTGPFTATGQLISTNGATIPVGTPVTLSGPAGTFTGVTGPNGTFSIPNVPAGTYTLSAQGFNPIPNVTVGGTNTGNLGTQPAVQMTFSVMGSLVDPNGNPVTGFTITGASPPGIVSANGNMFTITGLPPGTYQLTFTGGGILGSQSIQVTVPGPNGGVTLGNVQVTIGGTGTGTGGFGTGGIGSGQ